MALSGILLTTTELVIVPRTMRIMVNLITTQLHITAMELASIIHQDFATVPKQETIFALSTTLQIIPIIIVVMFLATTQPNCITLPSSAPF